MGAFNTVRADVECPNCQFKSEFEIQFKFGDVWQFEYRVGDRLSWGGNDAGSPGHKKVLLLGMGGPCPNCGENFQLFHILLEMDRIAEVCPATGDYTFDRNEYLILDP